MRVLKEYFENFRHLLYILYIFLIFLKNIIETIYLESKVAHIFHKTILYSFVRKLTSDIT